MTFPIDKPKIGFKFGQKYPWTWYFIRVGLAGKPHRGIDVICASGTPVKAPQRMQVHKVYTDQIPGGKLHPDYGRCVYAFSLDRPDVEMIFAHLYAVGVPRIGKVWQEGEIFAWTGNTGKSSAPHLHFETRKNGIPFDPKTL